MGVNPCAAKGALTRSKSRLSRPTRRQRSARESRRRDADDIVKLEVELIDAGTTSSQRTKPVQSPVRFSIVPRQLYDANSVPHVRACPATPRAPPVQLDRGYRAESRLAGFPTLLPANSPSTSTKGRTETATGSRMHFAVSRTSGESPPATTASLETSSHPSALSLLSFGGFNESRP